MPKRLIDLQKGQPLLDIASYGRRGPGARPSPHELELITYTARRTAEVVVKVSGGATSRRGALAHLQYIDRNGRLEIVTDQGEIVQGKEAKGHPDRGLGARAFLPRNPDHPTGLPHLAEQIWKLIGGMPPPRTEDERLRSELSARVDGDRRRQRDARSR